MQQQLVTITIPTFDSEATLRSTLEAVEAQTHPAIEVSVIDSESEDATRQIAQEFGVDVHVTTAKLMGARRLGTLKARGDFVLLLDSDQVLQPDAVERAVRMCEEGGFDMLFLEEHSLAPTTWLEKLFALDRALIHSTFQADPITGVLLPRFFRTKLLQQAFEPVPDFEIQHCIAQDHAIIFYEAAKLSTKVSLLSNAVFHREPADLRTLVRKNFRYGRGTAPIKQFKSEYQRMFADKTRLRRFERGHLKEYAASTTILLIKGVPFFLGKHLPLSRSERSSQPTAGRRANTRISP